MRTSDAFAVVTLMLCSLPAAAQSDIVGFWNQPAIGTALGPGIAALFGFEEDSTERADGPALVDYLGIPLNEEARARALSYDGALLGVPEPMHAAPGDLFLLGARKSSDYGRVR